MKVMSISETRKHNLNNRELALKAVKKVDSNFFLGKREFDRPRKNPDKQKILDRLK